MNQQEQLLETLACEWVKRPKGAPSFLDLAGSLRGLRREGSSLIVEYDGGAAASVEALVVAERLCCPEIGWELEQAPALRLLITATPAQLDMLEASLTLRG